MKDTLKTIFLLCAMLVFSVTEAGSVQITEIMYDLGSAEGNEADSGREWVEIYNDSGEDVELSSWRFTEEGRNHKIADFGKGTTIPAHGYAVIADNADKFLGDWPTFSGIVFDSSFSLKNSSGTLSLKNESGVEVYSFPYDSSFGASGDGNSLQFDGSKWVASKPSPGESFTLAVLSSEENQQSDDASYEEESSGNKQNSNEEKVDENSASEVEIEIDFPEEVFVGTSFTFSLKLFTSQGNDITNDASMVWIFGDGTSSDRQKGVHIYKEVGTYTALSEVYWRGEKYGREFNVRVSAKQQEVEQADVLMMAEAQDSRPDENLDSSQTVKETETFHKPEEKTPSFVERIPVESSLESAEVANGEKEQIPPLSAAAAESGGIYPQSVWLLALTAFLGLAAASVWSIRGIKAEDAKEASFSEAEQEEKQKYQDKRQKELSIEAKSIDILE
ncbi:MAG: lamin tail domain-containing protein [bacterium]|nr:lamin tail domain-containing protein [bacterium]